MMRSLKCADIEALHEGGLKRRRAQAAQRGVARARDAQDVERDGASAYDGGAGQRL